MTDARAEQPLGLPWTVRLFESAPIAPIWIGDIERVIRDFREMRRLPGDVYDLCGPS